MTKKHVVLTVYYFLIAPLLVGFYFHESLNHQIFNYSTSYFVALVFFTLIFAFLFPYLISRFINRHEVKLLLFSLLPAIGILMFVYQSFNFKFYYKQVHLFDPYLQMPKPDLNIQDYRKNDFVILTLGGSTTRNSRLPAEHRYPTLVEKELQKAYPLSNIKVINAGMDWYTTKHSLINYITYYQQVKPDVVIIMHAINDIYQSFSPPDFSIGEYKADYSHFYGPSIRGASPLSFESYLIGKFQPFWFSSFRKLEAYNFELDQYKSLESYKYYLQTLIKRIKQDNSVCLILEQRSLYKEEMKKEELNTLWIGKAYANRDLKYANHLSLLTAMDVYNKEAKKIAVQENIGYIEVGNKIESTLEYFKDDVHYTKEGTTTLAKTVSNYIKNNSIILTINN